MGKKSRVPLVGGSCSIGTPGMVYERLCASRLATQLDRLLESVPRNTAKTASNRGQYPTNAVRSQSYRKMLLWIRKSLRGPWQRVQFQITKSSCCMHGAPDTCPFATELVGGGKTPKAQMVSEIMTLWRSFPYETIVLPVQELMRTISRSLETADNNPHHLFPWT